MEPTDMFNDIPARVRIFVEQAQAVPESVLVMRAPRAKQQEYAAEFKALLGESNNPFQRWPDCVQGLRGTAPLAVAAWSIRMVWYDEEAWRKYSAPASW